MAREPITIVEIDVPRCFRTYGAAPCTAVLGVTGYAKCFNTFATCQAQAAFASSVMTLRYIEARPGAPAAALTFPALVSVSSITSTVNIAGADDSMSAFGRRATVDLELQDFLHHDRGLDFYQFERVSGAAQASGFGYDPATLGTHFGRLRARWPHYPGAACRVITGDLVGGAIVNTVTRAYVLTAFSHPDASGRVKMTAADVLDLADNDRAQCPKPSAGYLASAVTPESRAAVLGPPGIGAQYPAAGRVVIGSEVMEYVRGDDTLFLGARAVAGSTLATHAIGDTVQEVWRAFGLRIDQALYTWLVDYAGISPAFIPGGAWAAEVGRWAPEIRMDADVTTPTGVAKLAGELATLGVSVWWDEVAQLIGLKINRPPDGDQIYSLSEAGNLTDIEVEDREGDRLTDILFFTVQKDQTKSATDPDNYLRLAWIVDQAAKNANAYGDTKTRKVFCRWFNNGDDSSAIALTARLLRRFSAAPVRVKLKVTANDRAIGLTDVLSLTTGAITDAAGNRVASLWQVISRKETSAGLELVAQAYQWGGRYGKATANGYPTWATATAAQKAAGEFACDETMKMPDGSAAYEAI